MRIAATIARYLLGLIFAFFGLNGFLNFLHPVMPPQPLAAQYLTVMMSSHYILAVAALQVLCGILFLAGLYVPLALTLIAPVIVNILLYHLLMNPEGLPPGLVVTVLWVLVFLRFRSSFTGILQRKPAPTPV